MELSTFSRYGMRAMVRLAYMQQKNNAVVSLKGIAEAEKISPKYLEAIFATLKKNKLVFSRKGKNGGYMLNKQPDEITALDIVEALEGPLTTVNCLANKNDCVSDPARCSVINLWADLNKVIREQLGSKTIADILNEHNFLPEQIIA